MTWLNTAISFLDLSQKELLFEAFYIGLASKGSITFDNLKSMEMDNYKYCLKLKDDILKQLYGEEKK